MARAALPLVDLAQLRAALAGLPGQRLHESASQKLATEHVRESVRDPALQKALIPDYPVGGKRILISDDYYPALQRENVEVVTDPIERVTRTAS